MFPALFLGEKKKAAMFLLTKLCMLFEKSINYFCCLPFIPIKNTCNYAVGRKTGFFSSPTHFLLAVTDVFIPSSLKFRAQSLPFGSLLECHPSSAGCSR